MGANGSKASGILEAEESRTYRTLFSMGDKVKVLGQKDPKRSGKLPEESHTPNSVYVSFMANGKDVKEIACYDEHCKKMYAIHTNDHKGIQPHYHSWKEGKQEKEGNPLTVQMLNLLTKIRNYES